MPPADWWIQHEARPSLLARLNYLAPDEEQGPLAGTAPDPRTPRCNRGASPRACRCPGHGPLSRRWHRRPPRCAAVHDPCHTAVVATARSTVLRQRIFRGPVRSRRSGWPPMIGACCASARAAIWRFSMRRLAHRALSDAGSPVEALPAEDEHEQADPRGAGHEPRDRHRQQEASEDGADEPPR